MRKGIYKKLASWMAIFAVLVAFFAPTLSQAMSVDDNSNVIYQKVCSEHGSKVIPVELPSKHHDGMLGHSGHCAFCCTSAHTPIVSTSSAVIVVSSNESRGCIAPAYDSPAIQSTYQVSHSPQAPPAA